jgi:hypothetical protein
MRGGFDMPMVATLFDPSMIGYHKAMAAALSVGGAIERGSSILPLAWDFWILARDFKAVLADVEWIEKALPKVESVDKSVAERIKARTPLLAELHKTTQRMLAMASKRGIANRRLLSAAVQSIESCNEQLYDAIECLQLSLDPAISEAVREALGEYERGETVSLDSLV